MIDQLFQDNIGMHDASVHLDGQIALCRRLIGDSTTLFKEAVSVVTKSWDVEHRLTKSGLLAIWKNKNYSFGAKCLVTLWWGRPNHRLSRRVYSAKNIESLSFSGMEEAFDSLYEERNFEKFKEGLESLYVRFCRGDLHLDGIGVSFFTKFIHFFFASHHPKSNPGYLPVIADVIMRSAVFAEMIDRGENVNTVFYTRDASLRSYKGYVDRFNAIADNCKVSPFVLEDIVFNRSRGIGSTYVAAYNGRLSLPHWMAGRYNEKGQVAIVFNNLKGETYLFEGPTAQLWGELLGYEYGQPFNVGRLCAKIGCTPFDINSFFKELLDQKIIVDHNLSESELAKIKKSVNRSKQSFLKSVKGVGNFHSVFESVDNDYRSRISHQGIPLAASIELTYACNEACIHCYNPDSPRVGDVGTTKPKPKGEMTSQEYFPVLDAMKDLGVAKLVMTGGDPFMKKDFISILEYAHKLKFAISVYTNGQAMYADPSLYQRLRAVYPQYIGLSIYSTVPEVHDSITRRKGSCENTKEVARWCYEDAIGLQIKCPIMRANKDSYGEVFKFALGVNGMPQFDVNITSGIDGDCFASQYLRLTEEQLREVLKDPRIPLSIENTVGAIERQPDMLFCGAGESSFNVQPDGTLSPCCAFPMNCGNVRKQDLRRIWRDSKELHRLRELRYSDSDICGKEAFCKYCNRCPGQSFVEHGVPENHSEDNCFLAKIRFGLALEQEKPQS